MGINNPMKKQTASKKKSLTWLNTKKIVDAAKPTLENFKKPSVLKSTASEKLITISYRDSKGHVISSENELIQSQIAKTGSDKNLVDAFGKPLVPHKQIKTFIKQSDSPVQSESTVKQVSMLEREIHPKWMVDSTVNRHFQYKALQTLTNFASKQGMLGARARYISGTNTKMEGKHFDGYREVTAEIEYPIGPRLSAHVTASVQIDPAGNFVLPKTFKDVEGKEHPFTREAIAEMLKGKQFSKPSREVPRRSDQRQYKKPDPTRFRAI